MLKASISSLVESSGSKWLWVHAVLIWWITLTWTATVLWITWGGLAYRRREVRRLQHRVTSPNVIKNRTQMENNGGPSDEADSLAVIEKCEGVKRFRTVLVMNVPPDSK